MPWRAATASNTLQYENPDKQEAARFLTSGFQSYDEIIDGMVSVKRVDAWLQVIERFDPDNNDDAGDIKAKLQDRRQYLIQLRDTEFSVASELKAQEFGGKPNRAAVADGGAEMVEESEPPTDDDQSVMEYDDAAERESKRQDAHDVARMWKTREDVEKALQEEFERDPRRPHVVDALEKRLQEVASR